MIWYFSYATFNSLAFFSYIQHLEFDMTCVVSFPPLLIILYSCGRQNISIFHMIHIVPHNFSFSFSSRFGLVFLQYFYLFTGFYSNDSTFYKSNFSVNSKIDCLALYHKVLYFKNKLKCILLCIILICITCNFQYINPLHYLFGLYTSIKLE